MQTKTMPFERQGTKFEYQTKNTTYYRFQTTMMRIGTNGNSRNIETIVAVEIAVPKNTTETRKLEQQGFKKAEKGSIIYRGGALTSNNFTLIDHMRRYV